MIDNSYIEYFDSLFVFHMKSILRKMTYGIDGLTNDFETSNKIIKDYISMGLELIKNGHTPEELEFFLENISFLHY